MSQTPRRTTDRLLSVGGTPVDIETTRTVTRSRVANYLRQQRAAGRIEASDETIDSVARVIALMTSSIAADLAMVLVERNRKK